MNSRRDHPWPIRARTRAIRVTKTDCLVVSSHFKRPLPKHSACPQLPNPNRRPTPDGHRSEGVKKQRFVHAVESSGQGVKPERFGLNLVSKDEKCMSFPPQPSSIPPEGQSRRSGLAQSCLSGLSTRSGISSAITCSGGYTIRSSRTWVRLEDLDRAAASFHRPALLRSQSGHEQS